MPRLRVVSWFVVLAAVSAGGAARAQVSIVIAPGPTLAANAPALAAFNRAASEWSSRLSDPILVTINADLGSFGNPNIIGSTSSVILNGGYNLIRNQLVADNAAQPAAQQIAVVGALPTAAQFTATLNSGRSLSGNIQASKANLKAMGFTGLDTTFGVSDATITFNQAFNFDFDRSNGVTPGQTDFQTVAAHEIGHALGFFSSVDDADAGATSISPTTLDLFRFNRTGANLPTTLAEFTTKPRNLTFATDTSTVDLANNLRMSTGVANGDGNQASHWKADELNGGANIGIMDPTLAAGVFTPVGVNDLRAMDLIGWDVTPVPEPASVLLVAVVAVVGGSAVGRAGRRNRSPVAVRPLAAA